MLPKDREIIARGRFHATFDNQDGSLEQRIFVRPIHRLDEKGIWIPMDNKVLAPWKYQVDGKVLEFSIGNLEARSAGGEVRNLALPSLASTTGGDDLAVYSPYPGVVLEHQVTGIGLKETIEIHALPKLPEGFTAKWVTIPLTILGAEGFQLGAATAVDAKGQVAICAWVINKDSFDFTQDKSFELRIPIDWLYAAALPVTIDPTINCDGNDVTLCDYTPFYPYNYYYHKLGTKYDITSIPDDAIINAATHNIYCSSVGASNAFAFTVKRWVSQTWVEGNSYTTLNGIGLGATALASSNVWGMSVGWKSYNVRKGDNTDGLEKDVVDGNQYFSPIMSGSYAAQGYTTTVTGTPNSLGLRYYDSDLEEWYYEAQFHSDEGTNRPYLSVTYTVPSGATRSITRQMRHGRFQADKWYGAKW